MRRTLKHVWVAAAMVSLGATILTPRSYAQGPPSQDRQVKADLHDARELDAEVRAAKAAEKQVLAAWAAAFLTFMGTALLVWNLREARRANRIANAALAHAKQVADEEGRPWVAIEVVPIGFHPKEQFTTLFYEIRLRNIGRRIAKSVWFSHQIYLEQGDGDAEATNVEIQSFRAGCASRRAETTVAVMPGEEWVYPASDRVEAANIPPFQVAGHDWIWPAIAVVVRYRSDDTVDHETFRSVVLSQKIEGQLRRGIIRRRTLGAEHLYAMQRGGTHVT